MEPGPLLLPPAIRVSQVRGEQELKIHPLTFHERSTLQNKERKVSKHDSTWSLERPGLLQRGRGPQGTRRNNVYFQDALQKHLSSINHF